MSRCALVVAVVTFIAHSSAFGQSITNVAARLQDADRRAWLTDWYGALPVYIEAEKDALRQGDLRNALYAKFGRLRGQMQISSLADISEELARDLDGPLATRDPRLRLRALTVKGDIDLEWDVLAAREDWQQVRELAKELGDKGWENRAAGELGLVSFLMGNTGEATTLVQQALTVAAQSGDIGGQIRYLGAIANGLLMAGYPPLAMDYADRALKLANDHPETGFPFVVYSTKVLIYLALKQPDEAERFAKAAMTEARAGDRRIKEVELRLMLAQIAQKRNQRAQAIEHLQQAVATAKAGNVLRLLGDAESDLADAYFAGGDLARARRHALAAVRETEAAAARFMLPSRLGVLAKIYAAEGNVVEANRTYAQAVDVVEGIMVNVPSREAQARLIGVMSDLYAGHFRLVAERVGNAAASYEIIERARGRALADVLRSLPETDRPAARNFTSQMRTISQLQVRLLRAQSSAQRKQLLDALWEAEQEMTLRLAETRDTAPTRTTPVNVRDVQRNLRSNEVVLEYVLTEPRSYCLVITGRSLRLVPLQSRKQIEELVDRFVANIRNPGGVQSSVARALFQAVLRPISVQWRTAQRLIIVPDGKLHTLPFDSLLTLNAVEEHVTTITPSASVFSLLRTERQRQSPERPLLAVGGVPYDRMFSTAAKSNTVNRSADTRGLYDVTFPSSLPVLATAHEEALAAARLLGPDSVVLTGDRATESAVKAQDLRRFRILHFAVHAFADPKSPERAALVLLNDAAAGEDGLLQPREIGQLRLNASVVVLSACDTSVGPTIGQEGVQNLARAFLLAGAKSVVTTLWTVSDAISMALMSAFYENVTAGRDIAEALARSKRAVMEQFGPQALPTIAAFQLVGDGDHRMVASVAPQRSAANDNR